MAKVRNFLATVGDAAVHQSRKALRTAEVLISVLRTGLSPSTWRRTIRNALARQILSSGVEALGVVCFLAVSLGVLLVVQYDVWIGKVVQSRLLPPVMVVVIVRELGPLLVNFIVIARSGNGIATELGLMQAGGQITVLEGLGIDPQHFLIVPRVFGLIIATCCLTLVFIAVSFLSVYVCGEWIGVKTGLLVEFLQKALNAISFADVTNLLLKSVFPPLLAGSICCKEGLAAGDAPVEVPRAARTAVQRSVVMLCIVTALVSIGAYL